MRNELHRSSRFSKRKPLDLNPILIIMIIRTKSV